MNLNLDLTLIISHLMHIFDGIKNMTVMWSVFMITFSKKGNYIPSDADLSWHQEYTSHVICTSFPIEKNAKYWEKCDTGQLCFDIYYITVTVIWSVLMIGFSKKGNYIPSDADLSWYQGYTVIWSILLPLLSKMKNTENMTYVNFDLTCFISHLT